MITLTSKKCNVCGGLIYITYDLTKHRYLYQCYKCSLGNSESRKEIERRTELFNRLCPFQYRDFDSRRYPEMSKGNLAKVMAYNFKMADGKGLYLYGEGRTGKTRAIFQWLHRGMIQQGITALAFGPSSFGREINKKFKEGDFERWFETLLYPDIVFFDDFGKMTFTERVKNEFFSLIETRMSHGKVIFATDQDDSETLGAKMKDEITAQAIINRLRECCATIRFFK